MHGCRSRGGELWRLLVLEGARQKIEITVNFCPRPPAAVPSSSEALFNVRWLQQFELGDPLPARVDKPSSEGICFSSPLDGEVANVLGRGFLFRSGSDFREHFPTEEIHLFRHSSQ